MLRHSRAAFVAVFSSVLLVLMTLSVEAYRVASRHDLPPLNSGLADRLQASAIVATYFLVVSGYLIFFVLSYFALTWRVRWWKRVSFNISLFIASYAFLFFFMGGDLVPTWGLGVLAAGVASVLVADVIANTVVKPASTSGKPDQRTIS